MTTVERSPVRDGIGESVPRPDGIPKTTGNFAYSSDLHVAGELWGATLRAPHPRARVISLDPAPALALPGVHAVLTQDDVPGAGRTSGQIAYDQPVLCDGEVRFHGEPVAIVAADDPAAARRAVAAIRVEYQPREPLVDMEEAVRRGSVFREMTLRRGDPDRRGEVVIEGYYQVGSTDQAALGTEAGLAVPDGEGGLDIYGPTQWTHVDLEQIAPALGLAPDRCRIHPTGLGGAFGSREDLSVQIHLGMLALATGRPVRMIYDRDESFLGHVHRHPARLWYRHEADSAGTLVRVECRLILDGGAYASTSPAVLANAAYFTVGPYRCPAVTVEAAVARTNHPPNGAMRGFGAVQVAFGYEAQMDRLAAVLDVDPIELRLRNALATGDEMPTSGQVLTEPLPTEEVIRSLLAIPLPPDEVPDDPRLRPGGTGLTTPPGAVRRGVGYAVGIKNLAFSEAFDDYADARVVLTAAGVEIHTAAVEVGQGMVTVLQQIARTVLGVHRVAVLFVDTSRIGSAGSTSASRQTQMTGGAVKEAAEQVRELALARGGGDRLDDAGVWRDEQLVAPFDRLCAAGPIEATARFRHPPTAMGDEHGQGRPHVDFCVSAHRAVVDVDLELGLIRVVRMDTAQDVGRALNPQSIIGQIEGGTLMGVGHAYLEELILEDGMVRNASFTDYLLPTFADAPDVEAVIVEVPGSWGPFGAKGFSELPTISAGPAVAAAIRAATGRQLDRIPIRPADIALA